MVKGDDLNKLYEAVSVKFDIGSFDDFSTKMETEDMRKSFYDTVAGKGLDLGSYEDYESRLKKKDDSVSQDLPFQKDTKGSASESQEQTSSLDQRIDDSLSKRLASIEPLKDGETDKRMEAKSFFEEEGVDFEKYLSLVDRRGEIEEELKSIDPNKEKRRINPLAKGESSFIKSLTSDKESNLGQELTQLNSEINPMMESVEKGKIKYDNAKFYQLQSTVAPEDFAQAVKDAGIDQGNVKIPKIIVQGEVLSLNEYNEWMYNRDNINAYQEDPSLVDQQTIEFLRDSDNQALKASYELTKRQLLSGGEWGDKIESLESGIIGIGAGAVEMISKAAAFSADLRTGTNAFSKAYMATGSPTAMSWKEKQDELREGIRAYDQSSITESLFKGNILDAVNQGGNAFAESIPLTAGLMLSGPLGAGQATTLFAAGAVSAGQNELELISQRQKGVKNPDGSEIKDWQINLSNLGSFTGEVIGEYATLGLINDARRLASLDDILEPDALVDSWLKGVVKGFGIEGSSEAVTETINYLTDSAVGLEEFDLVNLGIRIGDASLVGGFSGSTMHASIRTGQSISRALINLDILDKNTSVIFKYPDNKREELSRTDAIKLVRENPELRQQIRDSIVKPDYSMNDVARKAIDDLVYGYYAPDAEANRAEMRGKEKVVQDLSDAVKEESSLDNINKLSKAVSEMEAEAKISEYNESKSTEATRAKTKSILNDNGVEIIDAMKSQDVSQSKVIETTEVNKIENKDQYESAKKQVKDNKVPKLVTSQTQSGIRVEGELLQTSEVNQGKFSSMNAAKNAIKDYEVKIKAQEQGQMVEEDLIPLNNKLFAETKKESLDEVPKEVIDSKDYYVLTSEKEGLNQQERESRMSNLTSILDDSGATYYKVQGVYNGVAEESLIVTGISEMEALNAGRDFGQESIFSAKKGLMFSDGRIVPLNDSILKGPKARKMDALTIMSVGGKKISMHIGLDWSNTSYGKNFNSENVHRLDNNDPNYDEELLEGVTEDRKRALGFALKFLNSIGGLNVTVIRNSEAMQGQIKSIQKDRYIKDGISEKKAEVEAEKYAAERKRGSFFVDKTIYVNLETVQGNTLFHEIIHPMVDFIKKTDPTLYKRIEAEVAEGKVKRRTTKGGRKIKGSYLEWAEVNYADLSREGQIEEAFAEMMGDAAYGHFKNKGSRLNRLREVIKAILTKLGVKSFPENVEAIDLNTMSLSDIRTNLAEALVDGRKVTVGGVEFEVGETDADLRLQLSEEESLSISNEVKGKVVEGNPVDTYRVIKSAKEKGDYISFSGEINLENVKKNSLPAYIGEASKLSLYNTTIINPLSQLENNIEGASSKEIKGVVSHNKSKIDSKIKSLQKAIDKNKKNPKKADAVIKAKIDLSILKNAKKEKDLVSQLSLILSIGNFNLKNSIYKDTFFKLGDSGLSIKTDKDLINYSESIFSLTKDVIKKNLKAVYNSVSPNVRDISKLWYDGANLIAQDMSSSYGVSTEQAAAIIATQSPQMPWFDNLLLADVIMDVLSNKSSEVFTKEMFDYYVSKSLSYKDQIAYTPTLEKSVGKKLSELNSYDKAIFIRSYFDLYLSRKAPIRIPTGTTTKFNQKINSSFGGYKTIEKAVSVFENGTMNNISKNVGDANKVRNFYLNIANPKDSRAVTIDTHAMAIALFKPLASNDSEVDFRPSSFAFYADAYRELADELGIEARALQSITWEAARAIFPAKKKANPKYKENINKLWSEYNSGSLSLEELHSNIFKEGDNPNFTEWSNFINELKDEKNRGNVTGRITKLGDVDTSINPYPSTRVNSRISTSREGDTRVRTRPSDRLRFQVPQVEEVQWQESKIGRGDLAITNRREEVREAAQDYFDGEVNQQEYLDIVQENSPIKPIIQFIDPASLEDIETAVGSKIEGRLDVPIQEGTKVGLRLDIPAYTNKNIWAITVHEDGRGKAMSYTNVARIDNVEFISSPKVALGIARGKLSKATIARMLGNWSPIEGADAKARGENAKQIVTEVMNDPSWSQVGMNPFRHSYFYDRLDGMPVVGAEQVVQIGGLVYAKNAEKTTPFDERFEDKRTGLRFQAPTYEMEYTPNALVSLNMIDIDKANATEWISKLSKGVKGTSKDIATMGLEDILKAYQKESKVKSIPKEVVAQLIATNMADIETNILRSDIIINPYDYNIGYDGDKYIVEDPKGQYIDSGVETSLYDNVDAEELTESQRREIIEAAFDAEGITPGEVRYPEATLPGGENYREFLIKDKSSEDIFTAPHYDELGENLIASIRADDRVGPNGEKILFVQEIQSDWVQGTNKGDFKTKDEVEELESKLKALRLENRDFLIEKANPEDREYMRKELIKMYPDGQGAPLLNKFKEEVERLSNQLKYLKPYLPWNQTDLWVGLAIRKVINQASKEGYDQIAFVNGEQSDIIQGHSDGRTAEFYNKIVPKNINNELKRLVKGTKAEVKDIQRSPYIDKHGWTATPTENITGLKTGKQYNTVINLTPELKAATDKVGPLRFQAPQEEGESNVYTDGLVSIGWDISKAMQDLNYMSGTYLSGFIDQKAFASKKRERYDTKLTTLFFKPFGAHSDKEVKEIMVRSRGALNSAIIEANEVGKKLKELNEKYNYTEQELNDLLHDHNKIKALEDSEIKNVLIEMRMGIDALSKTLIAEDLIAGQTMFTVDSNLGLYVTQSYKNFEVKGWEQTDNLIIKKTKDFLYREAKKDNPDATEKRLTEIRDVNYKKLNSDKNFAYNIKNGGSLDGLSRLTSIFKQRKEVPQEIKDFWGEIDDPIFNYNNTVKKVAQTITAERMYKDLYEIGNGKFISDTQTLDTFNQLVGAKWGSLEGKFVDNEMFAVMNQMSPEKGEGALNWVYDQYMKLVLLNKKTKTVWNPGTHVKNIIGNTAFATMNGHINMDVGTMYQDAKASIKATMGSSNAELDAIRKNLIEKGVLSSSASLEEIRNISKDLGESDYDLSKYLDEGNGKIQKLMSKSVRYAGMPFKYLDDKATRAYQAEDDVWKFYGFLSEKARYIKAGISEKEADDMAARNIINLYPNYNEIPRIIRYIGRSPLVGSFVAFQAESFRNAKNTVKLAFEEIGSGNPEIRKIGATRVAGTIATMALLEGLQLYTMQFLSQALGLSGGDEEESEERRIRTMVAEWDRDGNLAYVDSGVLEGKTNKYQMENDKYFDYINFSSISGVGHLKDILRLTFTDIDTEVGKESTYSIIKKMYEPFLGEEMTLAVFLEAYENKGNKIYSRTDDAPTVALKMIEYVGKKVAMPGIGKSAQRIMESFNQDSERVPTYETLALFGLRVSRSNVNKTMSINARNAYNDMRSRSSDKIIRDKVLLINEMKNNPDLDNDLNTIADLIAGARLNKVAGSDTKAILKGMGVSDVVIDLAYNRMLKNYKQDVLSVDAK